TSLDLGGRTSLGTLGALLDGAVILVSNDTGVMHVAEGVGTPSVSVSFDPEFWRWAPADTQRHRVLSGGYAVQVAEVLAAVGHMPARFMRRWSGWSGWSAVSA